MFPGILPPIPNLQFGYLYNFGPRVRSGRFTADYLFPLSLNWESTVFGEAHTEFQSFWNTDGFNSKVDISLGGGYRTILNRNTLLGVNGFYDTRRLGGTWYSSGSVGFQMASIIAGNDAIDLNFNWYGQLFNSNVIWNAFKYGPSNFDFQAAYSHELWNGGPDLRLSATGYKFDIGNSVYGWNGGAELWSRDAMFVLRYNVGHDKVNETYQEVGGFVNIGFQLENIFYGESLFTKPEPIFKSPRNSLRYLLTRPVNRDWHQPKSTTAATSSARRFGCQMITINPGVVGSSDFPISPSPIPFTDLAGSNTVTITIEIDPGANPLYIQLRDDTNTLTNTARFSGNTSIYFTRGTGYDNWFGVGMRGTEFVKWCFVYAGPGPGGINPGRVTVTWCP